MPPSRSPEHSTLIRKADMPAERITPQWMIEQGCTSTLASRFYAKVNCNGPIPSHCPELGACHLWTANSTHGYGLISIYGYKGSVAKRAHRVAWMLAKGPIPPNTFVLHHCDNPPCVNPNHLFLGNSLLNVRDMIAKGREKHSPLKGEANGSSKLTWNEVREIRRLNKAGLSTCKLGLQFGVSCSTIQWITSGKHWVEDHG